MLQIIGSTNIDFLSKAVFAITVSLALIVIGLVSIYDRGADMLNIDFTGGSSVTIVFKQDQTMSYPEVKDLLEQTELKDMNLSLVAVGEKGDRYTIRSVNQDIEAVQKLLHDKFGEHLETYHLQFMEIRALPAQTDDDTEGDDQTATARTDPFAGGTSAQLDFRLADDSDEDAGDSDEDPGAISYETVTQLVQDALKATNHGGHSGGMTRRRLPPTFMPLTPSSQPRMTWRAPSSNEKLWPRSSELSNLFPSSVQPV